MLCTTVLVNELRLDILNVRLSLLLTLTMYGHDVSRRKLTSELDCTDNSAKYISFTRYLMFHPQIDQNSGLIVLDSVAITWLAGNTKEE